MLKKGLTILFTLIGIIGFVSFIAIEKKSFAKGTLGTMLVNIVESETIKNNIRNSFGSSATSCIESYNVNLETQSQDTMIVIGIKKISASSGNCSIHTPINEILKKETLPFSVSGSGVVGKFGGLTIKIKDKYYSSSLKAQPEGSSFHIESAIAIQTSSSDLLMSYKNFYRVEGKVTGRLYNAMVANDFVDVKDFSFSVVFAESK